MRTKRSLSFRLFTRPLAALLIVALGCSGFASSSQAQSAPTTRTAKLKAAEVAKTLRTTYVAADLRAYRIEAFRVLIAIRTLSGSAAAKFMDELAVSAKKYGGDGIEPILLAIADAVAQRGDAATKNRLKKTLATLKGKLPYKINHGPNFLVPLTRPSSFLALDARADAVRALVDVMLDRAARGNDPGSLLDLLEGKDTGDAMCKLSPAKLSDGQTAPGDVERQKNCDDHGKPGKPGNGTVGGGLGDLASGGCTLGTPDQLQEMIDRTAAMEQCMQEMSENRGNPLAAVGVDDVALVVLVAVATLIVEKYVIDTERRNTQEQRDHARAVRNANDALKEAIDALDKAAAASDEAFRAEQDLQKANENVEEKAQAARDAAVNGTEEEAEAAKTALDKAKKEQREAASKAKEAKEKAEQAKKEAEAKGKKAEKKIDEANDKKPAGDSLDENDAFKSRACEKAFGFGLNERMLRERLGADWTDWKSRLKRVGNWSPDQESPYDALETSACGLDAATNQMGAAKCNSLVLCAEGTTPDENCGCNGSPSGIMQLIQNLTGNACAEVRCDGSATAKATPRGWVCDCSSGEQGEQGGRGPRPKPVVVDTMLGTLQPMASRPHAASAHVVRSLFDGQAHDRVTTEP